MQTASPIAQVIQQALRASGLNVRITVRDSGYLAKHVWSASSADFDMVVAGYAGLADPAMVLGWWNPDLAAFNKEYLRADPVLNKLIDSSLATPAGQRRTQALRDSCARIAQDANVIPLVSKDTIVAYRTDKVSAVIPRVEGYAVPLRRLADFRLK